MVNFYYQDLDVYYIALGFVDNVMDMMKQYGPVLSNLMSRLEKLSAEIPLEIARISGLYGRAIPAKEYVKVRSLVFETQSLVELLWRRKMIKEKDADELGDTLMVMAKMLTDLAGQSQDTDTKIRKIVENPSDTRSSSSDKIPIYRPKRSLLE